MNRLVFGNGGWQFLGDIKEDVTINQYNVSYKLLYILNS